MHVGHFIMKAYTRYSIFKTLFDFTIFRDPGISSKIDAAC